ncbi:MAG: Asp-tRNA(Asn)/Glu-tRNA(Gln) amidotransferase subunit GatC [Candidatus Omnitrophota bacterium]
MAISSKDVRYAADLARIELDDKELTTLSRDLEEIVGFIDKLKKAEARGVSPTSHILPLRNVLREDNVTTSLDIRLVLQNADNKKGNFFRVPQVVNS